ncbi:hypothetical protein [Stenotrophomonas sp. ZAC14D2_NAIMI4_6]|uniref:hypothetical protein n=1 Tax=Stenotrophomonas sp. ZAC14D2_NAIMI4_6 TaxID=2072406 RepID=UPI00131F39F4|nr:hypothetical protein [Stenotrophomonas sp. ZAC14D2_NAIMI4_6]
MMHAVARKPFAMSRRKAILILILAAGLIFGVSTFAFERGPYFCTDCAVASPVPDARTLEVLKDSRAPVDYVPLFAWATGTIYQICNPTHCTVYHENFESNWVGEGQTPREGVLPEPIDEGGSGGGGQAGGGVPIGGGCYGNCGGGGLVTVGPYQPCQQGAESKGELCIGEDGRVRPD